MYSISFETMQNVFPALLNSIYPLPLPVLEEVSLFFQHSDSMQDWHSAQMNKDCTEK